MNTRGTYWLSLLRCLSPALSTNYNSGIYSQPNDMEEVGIAMTGDEEIARLLKITTGQKEMDVLLPALL